MKRLTFDDVVKVAYVSPYAAEQPLFEMPEGEPDTIQARFERFSRRNPSIYARLTHLILEMYENGADKWSVKAAFEVMRYESIKTDGEDFKLPNDFTSRYARKLLAEFPQLEGFLETRELKSR